ncbi:hypothetical protein GALMADRAFT_234898, partial [Galerina marginata CBS 339.88]
KVGGRRLSISAKPKPQHHAEANKAEATTDQTPAPDYPRPAPPTGEPEAPHHHQHNEEEAPPKKERTEKKLQELAHKKVEMTRPTRDVPSASKGHATNMRIGQPAGKGLGI